METDAAVTDVNEKGVPEKVTPAKKPEQEKVNIFVNVLGEEQKISLEKSLFEGGTLPLPPEHVNRIKRHYSNCVSSGIGNRLSAGLSGALLAGAGFLLATNSFILWPVALGIAATVTGGLSKGSLDLEENWKKGSRRLTYYFNELQDKLLSKRQDILVEKAQEKLSSSGLKLSDDMMECLLACPSEKIKNASMPLQISVLQARIALGLVDKAKDNRDITIIDKITFDDWLLDENNPVHQQILLDKLKEKSSELGALSSKKTYSYIETDQGYKGSGLLKTIFNNVLFGSVVSHLETLFGARQSLTRIPSEVDVPELPSVKGAMQKVYEYEKKAGKHIDMPSVNRELSVG